MLGLPARLGLFDKDGPLRLLPGCAADRDNHRAAVSAPWPFHTRQTGV